MRRGSSCANRNPHRDDHSGLRQNARMKTPIHCLRIRQFVVSPILLAVAFLCGCTQPGAGRPWVMDAQRYAVAADHADASGAGAEILAMGGNAVDAAVATSFALAVVRPESCGLGGGGFMLIHRPGESPVAIDYREAAPAATRLELYRNDAGQFDTALIQRGGLSVAIPGTVRGLLHALEKYGSGRVSRAQVIAPAIRLANVSLDANLHLAESIKAFREACHANPEIRKRYSALHANLLDESGSARRQIDRRDLATTLAAIAERGADGFYTGPIAQQMIDAIRTDRGVMTLADLATYDVREVRPIQRSCFDHSILAMPPPSSGGAVIIEALNILKGLGREPLQSAHALDLGLPLVSPGGNARFGDYTHYLIEAMKPAFADRAQLLGDTSPAVTADVARMLDANRARRIAQGIDTGRAAPWTRYNIDTTITEDAGTSHLSVIDANGMAVGCTESINLVFGSRILVPQTGVILNNTMDDFALDTSTPNAFGLRQSERNLARAGARPLSSMSPTIVLKDGDVRLVVGASGGPRIITSTLQTLLHVILADMPVADAVAAPRVHHQWLPDVVRVQSQVSQRMRDVLRQRGHEIEEYRPIGHVQAVERLADGALRAACDPDKGGRPAGE